MPLVLVVVVVAAVHTHCHGAKRFVKFKNVMGFRVVDFEHEVLRFRREGVSDNGRMAATTARNRRPLAIVVTVTVTFQRVYEISPDSPTHATWVRLASVRHVPFEERPDVHLRELAREGIDDLAVTIERDRWKALHAELFGQLGICLHV